jgi:hypothetical protein
MSKATTKKTSPIVAPWLRQTGAYLVGPGRTLSLALAVCAIFFGAWFLTWREVGAHVLTSRDYRLGYRDVEISPPPDWIHSDIRADVFRNASLDKPLPIMDDNLAETLRNAFSLHPWIARVRRVSIRYPAGATVELDYRRPVLMVDAAGGLFPVDALGVLLPGGDFSSVEKSRYPRLVGVETAPLGTAGDRWGDARVAGAAEIAETIGPLWQELKLACIVPSAATKGADDYTYTLVTQSGARIVWGCAPSLKTQGEPPVSDKLAMLKQAVAARSSEKSRNLPQEFDLRKMR